MDSTALLVELVRRGIRPDAVLFADTGGELPETYAFLAYFSAWLVAQGFPPVTVVRRKPARKGYRTLEENCLANGTLPSLAFGRKACSLKWKREPLDAEVNRLFGKPSKRARVVRAIGYDAGPKDARRSTIPDDAGNVYWYPLRELGWDRDRCVAEIRAAGVRVPTKSACFFCPARKPDEVAEIVEVHPDLADRIVAMEACAAPNLKKIDGLWRKATRKRSGRMTDHVLAVRARLAALRAA